MAEHSVKEQHRNWDLVITPSYGWLNLNLRELLKYKDLVYLFVKRDFVNRYDFRGSSTKLTLNKAEKTIKLEADNDMQLTAVRDMLENRAINRKLSIKIFDYKNEENASGGKVVTAPTNGAAGDIPAVFKYYTEFIGQANQEGIINFMLTAGAIGYLFKRNASI